MGNFYSYIYDDNDVYTLEDEKKERKLIDAGTQTPKNFYYYFMLDNLIKKELGDIKTPEEELSHPLLYDISNNSVSQTEC
tara:strand:- start:57 stop:296 length:240 start_codon:yes stop_codon:yes gene_type:complete